MATQQKKDTVKKITENIQKSKSVVFSDYHGLSVQQMQDLRTKLKEKDAEFTVAKNTLIKKAVQQTELENGNKVEGVLSGPVAVLFSYHDEVAALKELVLFAKDFEKPKVKGGYVGTQYLSGDEVMELSKLPSKEVLLGQVVGGITAPLFGLVNSLSWNMKQLVWTINAIYKQKETPSS